MRLIALVTLALLAGCDYATRPTATGARSEPILCRGNIETAHHYARWACENFFREPTITSTENGLEATIPTGQRAYFKFTPDRGDVAVQVFYDAPNNPEKGVRELLHLFGRAPVK